MPIPKVPASTNSRKELMAQIAVVLLITFGPSAVVASIALVSILNGQPYPQNVFIAQIPGHEALSVTLAGTYLLIHASGVVGLVAYVLHRSGESFATLGLGLSGVVRDVPLVAIFGIVALLL